MGVRASDLRKTLLKYMREEREKLETYEVPCSVVSPQNPRGDKPFLKIHVSGSLQVLCRRGGRDWYPIIGRQYVKGREAVLSGIPSCDLYTLNCGKQKKVGWIDFLGLHSYCPFCHHDRHPVTHQEYDCAMFLLQMREKEEIERRKMVEAELALSVKQTLGWQATRLVAFGESVSSLWIPQFSNLRTQLADLVGMTSAYHNMVGAVFEGMNFDASSRLSEIFEPITGTAFQNFTKQMAGVDLAGKLTEIVSSSVRPVEIFSAGVRVAEMSSVSKVIEVAAFRSQSANLKSVKSLVGVQSGLLASTTLEASRISSLVKTASRLSTYANLSRTVDWIYRMKDEYEAGLEEENDEEGEDDDDNEEEDTVTREPTESCPSPPEPTKQEAGG